MPDRKRGGRRWRARCLGALSAVALVAAGPAPAALPASVETLRFILHAPACEVERDAEGLRFLRARGFGVRALPGDPAVGTLELAGTPGGGGFSGDFDIELARCVDAATGEDLGWSPQPFVLHGSFDRLRPGGG